MFIFCFNEINTIQYDNEIQGHLYVSTDVNITMLRQKSREKSRRKRLKLMLVTVQLKHSSGFSIFVYPRNLKLFKRPTQNVTIVNF